MGLAGEAAGSPWGTEISMWGLLFRSFPPGTRAKGKKMAEGRVSRVGLLSSQDTARCLFQRPGTHQVPAHERGFMESVLGLLCALEPMQLSPDPEHVLALGQLLPHAFPMPPALRSQIEVNAPDPPTSPGPDKNEGKRDRPAPLAAASRNEGSTQSQTMRSRFPFSLDLDCSVTEHSYLSLGGM